LLISASTAQPKPVAFPLRDPGSLYNVMGHARRYFNTIHPDAYQNLNSVQELVKKSRQPNILARPLAAHLRLNGEQPGNVTYASYQARFDSPNLGMESSVNLVFFREPVVK